MARLLICCSRRANADGRLFHPRPIKVAKAEWRRQQEKVLVSVEHRDLNYPGSTYKLVYLPERDVLVANYYQAAL